MADSYTSSLRLILMQNGENNNTWGTKTNTNWELIEQAVDGYVTINLGAATVTLTNLNGASDESRNAMLELTGTVVSAISIVIPAVPKTYIIHNKTTLSGGSVAVLVNGGTGVSLASGVTEIISNGVTVTSVFPAVVSGIDQAYADTRYARLSAVDQFTTAVGFATSISATEIRTPFMVLTGATSTTPVVSAVGKFDINGAVSATSLIAANVSSGSVNSVIYLQSGTSLALTKVYTSPDVTITSGGAGASPYTHGLGEVPKLFRCFLRCVTGDGNYVTGDTIEVSNGIFQSGGSPIGCQIYIENANTTQFNVRFAAAATYVFEQANKTTGAVATLTNNRWVLVVKAFA